MTTATDAAIAEPLTQRGHRVRAAHLAFRSWRRSRPFWAGVWAILGGAIIAYVPATAFKLFLIASSSLVMGVLVGALVGFFGLMLWFARPLRVLLGVLILLLSLVSFITSDFGGLILGMLMGLVGGSLALSWVPTKVTWGERRRVRKLIKAGGAQTEAVEQAAETVALPEPDSAEEATTPDLADALLEGDVIDPEQPAPRRFRSRRIGRHGAPTRHS